MKHLSDAPLKGRLLALPKNFRLGWKGLPGTNAFAYYEKSYLTAVKSFIALATGHISKAFYDSNLRVHQIKINLGSTVSNRREERT